MNRDDVLKLFEEEARKLEKSYVRQSDMILQLAELLADSRGVLSQENFATLVRIGAAMYKTSFSREQARADIAATMRESIESGRS